MSITATAQTWSTHADALADHALAHLVNRCDVFGLYDRWTDPNGVDHRARTAPWKRDRPQAQLTRKIIAKHYTDPRDGTIIGIHSTSQSDTCKWLAIDIDRHDGDPTPADVYLAAAKHWRDKAIDSGLDVVLEDSNGAGGFHLWAIFKTPQPTARVYRYAQWLVSDYEDHSLREAPETFPKQASVPSGGYGNWLRLPGKHHTRDHQSRFFDGTTWTDDPAAWLDAPLNSEVPEREVVPTPAAIQRTGTSDTYRGRVIDQHVEGSMASAAIALVLSFEVYEQYEAGQWSPISPRTVTGRFWIVGRDGEINAKVEAMLASTINWTGDITEGPQDNLNPCQIVIDNGDARWLLGHDEPTPLDRYIAKMPTGLRAGDKRSDYAYILAAHCINDLSMSVGATLPYLQQWNAQQAEPLTDEKLIDTARNARTYAKGPKQ